MKDARCTMVALCSVAAAQADRQRWQRDSGARIAAAGRRSSFNGKAEIKPA
jgi:hypothetical protein